MPFKQKRPCSHPGCPELVTDGRYCPTHEQQHRRADDERRGSSAARGYGKRWRLLRARYLAQHPNCAECDRQGKLTPAEVVDHITPHRGDQNLLYDPDNLQSLCKRCHDEKTAREDGGFGNARGGRGA